MAPPVRTRASSPVRTRASSAAVALIFDASPSPAIRSVTFDSGNGVMVIAVDPSRGTVFARRAGVDGRHIAVPLPAAAPGDPTEVRLRMEQDAIVLQVGDGAPVSLAKLTAGTAMRDFRLPVGVRLDRRYEAADPRPSGPPVTDDRKAAAFDHTPARPAATIAAPSLTVVVPSYNYARYLRDRLESVFAQTLIPTEIIVLDDASQDDSIAVAVAAAAGAEREVQIVCGAPNSGNVIRKWRKAAMIGRGDYLWIAEADDICRPDFLQRLIRPLSDDPRMAFAFCDSFEIDEAGAIEKDDFKTYYAALGDGGLTRDGSFEHDVFLQRFLFPRNLVLNASAVVWRTTALRDAFDRLGDQAFAFTCAGDWRLYVEACRPGATIGYLAAPLNGFRRHGASVTGQLPKSDHLAEIEHLLRIVIDRVGDAAAMRPAMDRHIADLSRIWSADTKR